MDLILLSYLWLQIIRKKIPGANQSQEVSCFFFFIHKWGQKTNYYQIRALDFVSCSYLIINNWSSDRIILGCLSSLAKKLPILKFCTRGIRLIISWIEWNQTHFFQSFLFKIIKKKIRYRHFLSDYCTCAF
jgi:hypothetical protein